MFISRGWGFIPPLFLIIAAGAAMLAGHLIGAGGRLVSAIIYALSGVIAGVIIGFCARALEARPGRPRRKRRGRRQPKVGDNAGVFLFIPTRYWSVLAGLIGVAAGVGAYTSWTFQGLPFIR